MYMYTCTYLVSNYKTKTNTINSMEWNQIPETMKEASREQDQKQEII